MRVDVLASAYTPNIDSLIAQGTFSDSARTRFPTGSGHGWSNMLTGVWADKHLVTSNDLSKNDYATYPDFLTRLERVDPAFNTLAVVSWAPLGTMESGGPMLGDAIDTRLKVHHGDSPIVSWAAAALEHLDPDATFVHLLNIDVVGHRVGTLDEEYRRAIEIADTQVGELVAAVKRRRTFRFEDWLILVATDHGRKDDGSHGGESEEEVNSFFLASGPSTTHRTLGTRPEIVDVAVTALCHLGVQIRGEWQMDGTPVGLRTPM